MPTEDEIKRNFICSPVKVRINNGGSPAEIWWEGSWRKVTPILCWQDYRFASGTHKFNWKMRRHRNYFHVLDEESRIWEIYLERTGIQRSWHLLAEIVKSNRG